MAKIGDIVRFLNSTGGGRITRIEGQIAYVEDEDGFEMPMLAKECVVVTPAGQEQGRKDYFGGSLEAREQREAASKYVPPTVVPELPRQPKADPDEPAVEETPTGDRLNVELAYEPLEIKHLNTTTFDAYLVNDSNYYLYFTYLTRADSDKGWTTRYAGIVEPNIQVWLGEVTREMLPEMDRIALQYVAFKRDKQFALKAPVAVENRLDTTKFFKLHCFRENPYFDKEVIAIDIVKNDIPQRAMTIDSSSLEDAMKQKVRADRPAKRPVRRNGASKATDSAVIEVDLHINALLDNTHGLSNADILNHQIDTFRKVMDENIRKKGQKIVFIHGKGEGVLRQALMKELTHRYKGHDVQDASFREYGYGATQVTIR